VDLLGFRCRVNDELMITDQAGAGYLWPTFGPRGPDIYSRGPASKSTLFVEGLGCAQDATCNRTALVKGDGLAGVRIDATSIYRCEIPVKFIGRLFLFVANRYWLVIDHVLGRDAVTPLGIESRFHTYAESKRGRNAVGLKSGKERLQMTFAALQPGVLQESRGMPARPTVEQTTIFRWMGKDRVQDNLHVAALNPGRRRLGLELSKEKRNTYVINVTEPDGRERRIRLTAALNLKRS
jgi:hypothetical protein